MAKAVLPNPLERRHLVERPLSAEQALRIAEGYLAEGRSWESIAFLAKAGARDRLRELGEEAVQQGDAFLLREVFRALGETPGAERWRALAETAASAGKARFATEAERLAASDEG